MAIYVDADACPVKAEIERVATRHKVEVYMVCNGGLRLSQNPFVEMVYVPDGPDEADKWIAERAGVGDVVINPNTKFVRVLQDGTEQETTLWQSIRDGIGNLADEKPGKNEDRK